MENVEMNLSLYLSLPREKREKEGNIKDMNAGRPLRTNCRTDDFFKKCTDGRADMLARVTNK